MGFECSVGVRSVYVICMCLPRGEEHLSCSLVVTTGAEVNLGDRRRPTIARTNITPSDDQKVNGNQQRLMRHAFDMPLARGSRAL